MTPQLMDLTLLAIGAFFGASGTGILFDLAERRQRKKAAKVAVVAGQPPPPPPSMLTPSDDHECWAQWPLQVSTNEHKTYALYACDTCGNFWTDDHDGAFTLEDFLKAKPSKLK